MKKYYIAMALMSCLAVSCDKKSLDDNFDDGFFHSEVVFKSEMVDTKATIGSQSGGGHPVSWKVGDKIWIYRMDFTAGGMFTAKESTRNSSFVKNNWYRDTDYNAFVNLSTSDNGYYAYYPFNRANSADDAGEFSYPVYYGTGENRKLGFLYLTLPNNQKAIENGVDPEALIMTAKTAKFDDPLIFYNAVSLLEFQISAPENISVTSVEVSTTEFSSTDMSMDRTFGTYTATTNEVKTKGEIAGKRVVYCPDSRSWIHASPDGLQYAITLSKEDGSALIADSSTNYYVSIWPGLKKEFKVVLKGIDSSNNNAAVSYTKTTSSDKTFAQNKVYPLGTIEWK